MFLSGVVIYGGRGEARTKTDFFKCLLHKPSSHVWGPGLPPKAVCFFLLFTWALHILRHTDEVKGTRISVISTLPKG